MSALAFTLCFAAWTLNGVLVTFLVENGVFRWDQAQIGWLIGIPVLSGSLMRLPVGLLTDRFGGRKVYTILLLLSAIPMYLLGSVSSYRGFLWGSLGFGLSGAAFAVGIAFTSVWFSKERQGTALGIFGAGNAGSAITSMGAPLLLRKLTGNGANIDAWRTLPKIYAAALVAMGILFFLLTSEKKSEHSEGRSFAQMLSPLKRLRVWRFGLYYFLVFGCFVALAQWLKRCGVHTLVVVPHAQGRLPDAVKRGLANLDEHALAARPDASGWIDPWARRDGWRSHGPSVRSFSIEYAGTGHTAQFTRLHDGALTLTVDGGTAALRFSQVASCAIDLHYGTQRVTANVYVNGETAHVFTAQGAIQIVAIDALAHAGETQAEGGRLTAPMPGKVVSFAVKAGDAVKKGQALAVMEAMKMEHTISAPADGTVAELLFAPGDQVTEGSELLCMETATSK